MYIAFKLRDTSSKAVERALEAGKPYLLLSCPDCDMATIDTKYAIFDDPSASESVAKDDLLQKLKADHVTWDQEEQPGMLPAERQIHRHPEIIRL
jgi:hypothetical protein